MSDQTWLIALVGAAVLLVLAHRQGLRWNIALAKATARDLEEALRPEDRTYTWIGGAIGFHCTYELAGGLKAKSTATFLPRHSPAYVPVARLLSGPDRLQVTFELGPRPEGRALLLVGRSRRHAPEGLGRRDDRLVGRPAALLAAAPVETEWVRALAERLRAAPAAAAAVREIAFEGGRESTLYCLAVPRPGAVRPLVELLEAEARSLTAG